MEIIIAILYYFRQGAKLLGENRTTLAGNLDPFYILGVIYVIKALIYEKKKLKKYFIFIAMMIIYSFIQIIFNHELDYVKLVVNILKISICIASTLFIIDNFDKLRLYKITKIIAYLYSISIPIAFIFKNNQDIWRINDFVNKYTLRRLKLFYLEPSELGFHVAIIIIILIAFTLIEKERKIIIRNSVLIFMNIAVLYLARPLAAILYLGITVVAMLISDYIIRPSKRKLKLYIILGICLLVFTLIMIITKSSIYMRVIDTLNGEDSSNRYRIGVSLEVLKKSFIDYFGIGCGFGNLNTQSFISKYSSLGLTVVVTNSFIYYVIETGIFGIITLLTLIIIMLRKVIMSRSPLKVGVFIFLMLYQIFAGHFTSGLYWVLYGIILSNYDEKKEIA